MGRKVAGGNNTTSKLCVANVQNICLIDCGYDGSVSFNRRKPSTEHTVTVTLQSLVNHSKSRLRSRPSHSGQERVEREPLSRSKHLGDFRRVGQMEVSWNRSIIIHVDRIVPYKPTIFWGIPNLGIPQMASNLCWNWIAQHNHPTGGSRAEAHPAAKRSILKL